METSTYLADTKSFRRLVTSFMKDGLAASSQLSPRKARPRSKAKKIGINELSLQVFY